MKVVSSFSMALVLAGALLAACGRVTEPQGKGPQRSECTRPRPLDQSDLTARVDWTAGPTKRGRSAFEVRLSSKAGRAIGAETKVRVFAQSCCFETFELEGEMVRDGVFLLSTDKLKKGDWTFDVKVQESEQCESFQFQIVL